MNERNHTTGALTCLANFVRDAICLVVRPIDYRARVAAKSLTDSATRLQNNTTSCESKPSTGEPTMEKPKCSICDERHDHNADCIHILKGELHYERKLKAELQRDFNELELGYNALRHTATA